MSDLVWCKSIVAENLHHNNDAEEYIFKNKKWLVWCDSLESSVSGMVLYGPITSSHGNLMTN